MTPQEAQGLFWSPAEPQMKAEATMAFSLPLEEEGP